jgi:signal transduction histidine kinase
MPITQAFFHRSNLLLLAAGIAVLVLVVASSLWLTEQTRDHFDDVVATRELRSQAADLMSVLQDAETGQRGFLLTRDRSYLEPYDRAGRELEQRLTQLSRAGVAEPPLQERIDGLAATMRAKMAELAETVALAERGDTDAALALVREGRGKVLMDDARRKLSEIIAWSEAALRDAIADQERASLWLSWVTIGGAVIILGLAGAAAWTIMAYTRELVAAEAEVRSLNVGLEERVRQRTDALIRANDEIQRFAYIVTHDLRAPLVNIMGFTSELEATFKPVQDYLAAIDGPAAAALRQEAELALRTEIPEAIGFIRSSTRKMDALINAILKISRDGSRTLKPERIDLAALLEAAAGAVHHQASSEGGGIEIDSRAGNLVSDRLSLDQILGNLLDNAIKYRDPARPIRIVARTRRERTGWVTIEISDNGRGIAPADHERIFELFRRSGAQNTAGEGIGLAHVRALARNLGGDITVRSQLGEGTTFSILLPPDLAAAKRSTGA